jgi:S-layer homology domain.
MASRHIARGVTDDTFDPEGKVTRAQFVALLTRTLGIPENKAARAHFTDVQRGDWYHGNVEAAFAAGLVKGYEDGTFRPNAHITRQEIAVMVARGVQYGGRKVDVSGQIESLLSRFIDQNQISWWAREGAAIAVKEGIVLGRTTDQYVPDADSTRAEATVMLKRALRSLGEIR